MNQHTIRAPFFEIGPKSYLYGQDVVDLAIAADNASEKYGVDIIFTTPIVSISAVKAATKHIHVFAPHMDPLEPGRGLADILPESLVAAGAEGVIRPAKNACQVVIKGDVQAVYDALRKQL